jgi:type I restriction enzyme S subunit
VDQLAGFDESALCDGPFGSNLKTEHYTDRGPRVIRLQNIGDGEFQDEEAHISEEHFEKLKRHRVYAGDLVVASLGVDLPRACQVPPWLGPAIVKADCLRFRVHEMLADPRFVLHALNSPSTRKRVGAQVHGVGRPRIGLTLFRQTAIPLPPRNEQERISEQIEELVSLARKVELNLTAQERRSNRLRQSVLEWAFEGKLVDQNPADEPVDVLLARIRAERTTPDSTKKVRTRKLKVAS